jgi:HEAT repeat protein
MTIAENRDHWHEAAENLLLGNKKTQDDAEAILLKDPDLAIKALIHALKDPKGDLGRACLLLGALRARDALPTLLHLATADKTEADALPYIVRSIAEIVDGRDAFDDRVQNTLDTVSSHPNRYARAFAAKAYGQIGDARSETRLAGLLQDSHIMVKEHARDALNRLQGLHKEPETDALLDFSALVEQTDAEGGPLKPWLDDLENPKRAVRQTAITELVKARNKAVPFLLQKLNQPEALSRVAAATALGRIQAPEAVGPLLIAATTPAQTKEEHELRPVALRALAACLTGLEEGLTDPLLPIAEDPDRFVRAAAMLCLGRLAERDGMRAVVKALMDSDPFVVESAAIALSEGVREDDSHLVLPILNIWDSLGQKEHLALREAILIALSRIDISDAAVQVRVRHRVRHQIRANTAAIRKSAIVLLERLFSEDDPPVIPVIDLVLASLADSHPEVRLVAGSFMARHIPAGLTHGVPRLEQALSRNEKPLSSLCLEALRRHDTKSSRALLEATTFDEDQELAALAARLLEDFSPAHTSWTFVGKAKRSAGSGRQESQRPEESAQKRVRPILESETGSSSGVVEARFSPLEKKDNHPERTSKEGVP